MVATAAETWTTRESSSVRRRSRLTDSHEQAESRVTLPRVPGSYAAAIATAAYGPLLIELAVVAPRTGGLEVAYQVDHIAVVIRGDVVPAEPDLLEHPE